VTHPEGRPRTHTLVVRLDNAGDVLLAGPAVRAVAAGSDRVTMLCGPNGAEAAYLLPGVDDVISWRCPWIDPRPDRVDAAEVAGVVETVRQVRPDRAVVLTSFHQSPLPTALLLRMAGVGWVGAISDDYPGSLLDLRHRVPEGIHEVERALSLARAAGYDLQQGDRGRLALRDPLPPNVIEDGDGYVVLHPGTSVPARAWPVDHWRRACAELVARGHRVVVTGGPGESDLTAQVAGGAGAMDLGGRTRLGELAAVLRAAAVVVAANTGPAHLAAAVGRPVVSLFAPTVPWSAWGPWAVPTARLGAEDAPCRGTRATVCPVHGHPCLTSVAPADVVHAVEQLVGTRPTAAPYRAASRAGGLTLPGPRTRTTQEV